MLEVSATGDRPVDGAWDRYVHPVQWPTWAPQIRSVTCDDDVIATGTTGVVHGPALIRIPFRIEAVDPERREWTWRVGVGPVGVRMDHGVESTDDGGTHAWARIHLPSVVAAPYAPIARLALRRLVRTD